MVEFIKQYILVITHKAKKENVVDDTLSHVTSLCVLSSKITTFDHIKEENASYPNIGP